MQMSSGKGLLAVRGLEVRYGGSPVLHGVDLEVGEGEIVGVVGESGSGKSTLLNAVAGLLPCSAEICAGSILYDGSEISIAGSKAMQALRGRGIGYLFQNAEGSFDPLFSIKSQFDEALKANGAVPKKKPDMLAVQKAALERVGLDDADRVLGALPSELSGGMCQRVALAFAVALGPKLLLADEPTSALDGKSQDKVVDILRRLNVEEGLAVLIVSHDIDLVASLAHRIIVMRSGRIVESGRSDEVMDDPQQPYTRELIAAVPRVKGEAEVLELGACRAS